MLSKNLQSRYLVDTFPKLAERIASSIGNSTHDIQTWYQMILRKQFVPAGNTLLAGIDKIRPNCTVLESIHENNFKELAYRASRLWEDRIGIGFDLSKSQDPVGILHKLSHINTHIKLHHRPQRGNMAVLDVNHARIKDFITCKDTSSTNKLLYNFNLSVGLYSKNIDQSILYLISKSAWKSGDPGIVFLDRIQGISDTQGTPNQLEVPSLGKIHTLVPCGEQGLFSNEVCTLGSINLACPDFWDGTHLIKDKFRETIQLSVCFLDDVIDKLDINDIALKTQSLNTRRIGLGVMGWADVLNTHRIAYGSHESFELAHTLGQEFKTNAHTASQILGKIRGPCPALKNIIDPKTGTQLSRRNIAVTCIAPTGGITLLTHNKGFAIEPELHQAHAIKPNIHLKMQKIWQNYMDGCVSKTINMPSEYCPDDICTVWNQSNKDELKSTTIYRNGSKSDQPITTMNAPYCTKGYCDL